MKRTDQIGQINILLVPLILAILLLLGAIGFGAWAFSSRQDYKDNVDQKIAKAVEAAKLDEGVAKDKAFVEAEKQPLKSYQGPAQYGSLNVPYPKTWSGYISTSGSSGNPLDGYFHPGVVPSVGDPNSAFALRVQVVTQSYSSIVQSFTQYVAKKSVTATPYSFPKVPGVVGVRFDGGIKPGLPMQGSLIVIPLRDKTLKVWTESPIFVGDFNNNILPGITFSP